MSDWLPQIYRDFECDHPEHAGKLIEMQGAGGPDDVLVPVDTIEAFVRWCHRNGCGDASKILGPLADVVPELKDLERRLLAEENQSHDDATE